MSISIAIASYFNRENIDKWSHFDCLKYLAKVCANFTSEDRDEIIDMYKNQLRSINSCETRLKKARSKAYKLAENVERSFQREEVTSFFESQEEKLKILALGNSNNNDNNNNTIKRKIMNHAALTLWNWRLISPDEEPTLTAIISAIQSAHDKNNRQLIESLKTISSTIDEITKVLLRIYEKCDSYIFYQKIRPYLSGWYNDEDLPNGLKYEGVDGCDENGNPTYRQYGGGSAGQSSLIQSLDIALNIEHHPTVTKPITNNINNYKYSHEPSNETLSNNYNNTSKKGQNIQQQQQQPYIYKIRQNIPGNHRRFLEDLTKAAIIRDYIISCIECDGDMEIDGKLDSSKIAENNELVEAYNDCLNKMAIFRSKHLQIVCVYIIQARNKSSKVELDSNNKDVTNGAVTSGSIINGSITNVRGTGGTDLMPFLKQMREETKSKEIKNFKGSSDFKEQKKITRT
ncbi:15084_t:CDS:2, partial [Entrophospora sp. SA101]